jgi:2-C-methyl-D-erythritol 2,4-cyclodiphosphate synthase
MNMRSLQARLGIGYDVHRFGDRRRLMLGGVYIPSRHGLEGHSDADVLLHAVCDALLGAAALGDIGRHFPNSSPRYKNIPSLKLLARVREMLHRRGYTVGNIDVTVILERPKIARYAGRMIRNIARTLNIQPSQVSVKATTNEGMGFIGRGDGCAAVAIASVFPPE